MKKRHENESLQHAIFTASPDGIAIMDLNGRIRMVSDKVLVMFGLECEAEAIGKTLFDFIDKHIPLPIEVDLRRFKV